MIFDEIQACPNALNTLKYFCEDAPEYYVACAGSLLGLTLTSGFPVGKVDFLTMGPMTFREFLLANGDENLVRYMESVEEMCDRIALINKSKLVITGRVDDIRRQYGNDNVDLVYTDGNGRHTEILPRETDGAAVLETYLAKGVQINSYKELMPRMNDIFIKLVKGEETK